MILLKIFQLAFLAFSSVYLKIRKFILKYSKTFINGSKLFFLAKFCGK